MKNKSKHDFHSVGGCDSNPGVWDNGNGGLTYESECRRCGILKRAGHDYTGCRPGNTWGPEFYRREQRVYGKDTRCQQYHD